MKYLLMTVSKHKKAGADEPEAGRGFEFTELASVVLDASLVK